MSDLWIIVCVLCCFSLTQCQTVSIVQDTANWFKAFLTCKLRNGRLPDVIISNYQLELQDPNVTKNIFSPFWIGATYDFLDINVAEPHNGYKYPYTCCENIVNAGGNHVVKYSDCSPSYKVICATSTSEISTNVTISNYYDWHSAYLHCKERNLRLPTKWNAQFLNKVTIHEGDFWLDGIRQINLKPDIEFQNRNCLQSLIGRIQERNCSNTLMTTVCLSDNNTSGSEPNTDTPSVNTESPSKTGSLQTKTSEAKHTIVTSKPTESTQFQTIANGNISTSPNIQATFTNLTNKATSEKRVINKGAVIGGVVGSVVVAIVITVVIVMLLRKYRSRKDNNDKIEHHVSMHNREKPGIMNSSNGVCRNAWFEKGNTKTTTQAETSKDFHTQSLKHTMKEQQPSDHGKAVENTYERVVSVLYSVVQKDLKPNKAPNCGEQVKRSEDNDEEYDKTSYCSKINQAVSSGNVYDKANFKRRVNSEYDTAHDINVKHNDNSEYDTTDDINFKHNVNSEYDTTNDINISIDTTYDHV